MKFIMVTTGGKPFVRCINSASELRQLNFESEQNNRIDGLSRHTETRRAGRVVSAAAIRGVDGDVSC